MSKAAERHSNNHNNEQNGTHAKFQLSSHMNRTTMHHINYRNITTSKSKERTPTTTKTEETIRTGTVVNEVTRRTRLQQKHHECNQNNKKCKMKSKSNKKDNNINNAGNSPNDVKKTMEEFCNKQCQKLKRTFKKYNCNYNNLKSIQDDRNKK